jgi:hypothetical protein
MLVKMKIGAIELQNEFDFDASVDKENVAISQVATNLMVMAKGILAFHEWAKDTGATAILAALSGNGNGNGNGNGQHSQPETLTKMIPVTKIAVEFSDNMRKVKIFGGDYTKYGVPAYPDSCADGVGLALMNFGDTVPEKPMNAIVQMNKDGKPFRVTEVRFVNG